MSKGAIKISYKYGSLGVLFIAAAGAVIVDTIIKVCKYSDYLDAREQLNKANDTLSKSLDFIKKCDVDKAQDKTDVNEVED